MTQITAKIIAHSITEDGKEIITWELEYPRFIHAEFMTHRLFSRNAASSRAIPVSAMIDQVKNNPAMPIHWGKNQAGMQAKEELPAVLIASSKFLWKRSAKFVAKVVEGLQKIGLHKQASNRLLEPYQMMKTVMTTTEDDNWFWLRNHTDAQPEIHALASVMLKEKRDSHPVVLRQGDWHVPYYGKGYWRDSGYVNSQMEALFNKRDRLSTLKNALAISSSCCAQVSYRKLDDRLEKAEEVYARLIESEPVHASPFEHQATPIAQTKIGNMCPSVNVSSMSSTWENGITHVDRNGNFWSGNFKGWIQHRQLIKNNACWDYKE